MAAGLPVVGVVAAVQGMASFTANANTFNQTIQNMMRSANLLVKAVSNSAGANAASANAAKIQKAQDNLIKVQNAVVAANTRQQGIVSKVTTATAQATQRAMQLETNAVTRAGQAHAKIGQIQQDVAARVSRAQQQQVASTQRLTTALNLAAQANTPARQARAANAAIAAASAQQRVQQVTANGARQVTAQQNAAAAASQRAMAATLSTGSTVAQGAARVAAATANANAQQVAGAAKVAAANASMASASEASFAAMGLGAVAMAAVIVASLVFIAVTFAKVSADLITESAAYQNTLAAAGAISGEAGVEIQKLSTSQLQLTRTSTQTATALSGMTTEMIKAGLSVEDVTAKALEVGNAMVVASNGELKATQAATLLQVAYAGFGKVAADAGKLTNQLDILPQAADAITSAVQRSTLTFSGFSDAARQGGGVVARMGYTLQEFTALVGTMGLTIQSGTEIGTGLRMMFQNLQNPSDDAIKLMKEYNISLYDAQGAIRPARDLVGSLSTAFGDNAIRAGKLTQATRDQALATLFGGRSIKTVSALLNAGTEEYDKMFEAVSRTGTAQEASNRILGSTASIMTKIANTWTALKLAFGQGIEPFVNSLAKSLEKLVQAFAPTNEAAQSLGETIGGFLFNALSALGEIIQFVASTVVATFSIFDAFKQLQNEMGLAVLQFVMLVGQLMQNLWNIVVTAFNNISGAGNTLSNNVGSIGQAIASTISTLAGSFWTMATGVAEALTKGIGETMSNVAVTVGQALNNMGQGFNAWLDGITGIPGSFASAMGQLADIAGRAFSAVISNVNKFLDALAGLPLVGELVSGARGALGGFVSGFSSAVGAAGVAIKKFASVTVAAVKSIQLPNFRNYAAETLAAFKAAQAGIQKAGSGALDLGDPTEAGSYPPGGGGGKAPKGAGDKAAKDYAAALDKAREILRDFFRDADNLWRDHAEKIGDAFAKAEQAVADVVAEQEQDIAKSIKDANDEILKLDTTKYWEKDAKTRREALDNEIENTQKAREHAAAEEEVIHQRSLEDVQIVEQQKRDAAERTFDKTLETAARTRDEERAGEDRSWDKQQEQRQKQLDKQQKLVEDALDKRQDAEKAALDANQKLVEAALNREQDARENALKTRLEAEKEAMKASQDARMSILEKQIKDEGRARDYQTQSSAITTTDATDRAKAEAEYQNELRIGVRGTIAAARRKEKLDAIAATTAEARAALEAKQAEANADLSVEEQNQARIAALQAQFDAENTAREISADAQTLALKTQHETELAVMKAAFAAQDLVLKEQQERAIDQLHEDHERARDELSDQIENDRLNRQKDRAREDREFAEKQEAAKRKYIQEETAKQLVAARKLEDDERARKEVLDTQAVADRKVDEQKRATLTEQLDQEEYDRRIVQINEERDARVAQANEAIRLQQEAIATQLAKELVDLNKQLEEKITTIKEQYVDRLESLIEEGGEAMRPIIDNIGEQMKDAFSGARDQVAELVTVLEDALRKANDTANAIRNMPTPKAASGASSGGGGGLSAPLRPGGKPGETQAEVDNFIRNTQGKQYGGTVNGPYGSSQLIEAHGGEFFAGIGGYGTAVAAVRSAESMLQRGMGGSTNISNTYSYNVNANYGRTQAEGSVRLDLAALVALTSK